MVGAYDMLSSLVSSFEGQLFPDFFLQAFRMVASFALTVHCIPGMQDKMNGPVSVARCDICEYLPENQVTKCVQTPPEPRKSMCIGIRTYFILFSPEAYLKNSA